MIAGRQIGLSNKASIKISLTMVSRGEVAIIIENIGILDGLLSVLKAFSVLYVLAPIYFRSLTYERIK